MQQILTSVFLSMGLLVAVQTEAGEFFRTGKVTRVITERAYGGCMVHINTPIGGGCPNNGWVSLDCVDKYNPSGTGKRMYGTALVAFSMAKRLTLKVVSTQKHNGYCIARRVDILN